MKRIISILLCFLLLFPIHSVYAEPEEIYEGGSATVDMTGDTNIYEESSGGDYTENRSNNGTSGVGSSGTHVELSPAEKKAANSKNSLWDTLRSVPPKIKQKYIGQDDKHCIYAGTGKLSQANINSLINGVDSFSNNIKDFPSYDRNSLPMTNFGNSLLDNQSEINEFKNLLENTSGYKNETEKNTKVKGKWNNNYYKGGGSGSGSGGNGSGNSGGSSYDPNNMGNGTSNEGYYFVPSPVGNGSNKNLNIPQNYGKITYKNGLLSLNNAGGKLGSPFKVGDFSKYATDFMQFGILDSNIWSNRFKTLKKYYKSGVSTSLKKYDDVAYVTDYCIASRNAEYYKISDYSAKDRKWWLYDGNGKVVQSGTGTKMLASIHFGKKGKYRFVAKQKAKITTGIAVHYYKRQYLILIPTNTMLYFKEEETGPVILKEKHKTRWVKVTDKKFNVKGLGGKDINSGVERIK